MTKLDKLLELNKLEKQNRRNRLEDKLRQQEYYGEIEELFDPLTKTLNDYNDANNLYGFALVQKLPYKDISFTDMAEHDQRSITLGEVLNTDDDGYYGYWVICDLK